MQEKKKPFKGTQKGNVGWGGTKVYKGNVRSPWQTRVGGVAVEEPGIRSAQKGTQRGEPKRQTNAANQVT